MLQVTAAVIIEDGRLLLARRPAGDHLEGFWELPGGKVEPGESPEQCLRRELIEELNMRSEVGDLLATAVHHYAHGTFELLAYRTKRMS
jgi:8-oxo-dGTP diphosphatase